LLEKGATVSKQNSRVINIGSIDGIRVPLLDTFAYSTSKAAVHHLSRHLALKLSGRKITVNAIAAGAFETKMMAATLKRMCFGRGQEEQQKKVNNL
jgi:NAD(P)-dependent dehydrogenase (short-subunit alcohol dehydrogenase family)